ncbi:MAG: glucans biosynthesis glucosyltransferase MdoH [Verrucomicrobiota bacterium]
MNPPDTAGRTAAPADPALLDPGRITRRRTLVATLVLLLTGPAVLLMADLHWRAGFDGWKGAHLALFTILFTLIAFGATQALIGFFMRGRHDPCRITKTLSSEDEQADVTAPTAVVMPICNEDPARVFEGVRVIYESLRATGQIASFDFFLLSDSGNPNRWIEEEASWQALIRQLDARGRIFYRKRRVNTNKKSGNLADFCRRWGRRYRYMLVLDADSIMTGSAIVKLVRLMEKNPGTGIIQTVPRLVNGETVFARLQQFASRLYGPVFARGLSYWQLGEANYWGHNAIIRLAPFIEHCSLPDLPGSEPFGGRILSHDYVEAALMRRAGWAVWLAPSLEGSYEECPANLIDFAKRDRRWLQGNLQHAWLLAAKGLHAVNRLHLALGILAYLASPLWFAFLVVTTIIAWQLSSTGLELLPVDNSFARYLPLSFTAQALALLAGTLGLLFLPKVLALLDLARWPGAARGFGGWPRVVGGVLIETVAFTLIAPVLMLFHTKFIALTLLGRGVAWIAQRRGQEGEPDWREVILTHSGQTVLGLLWAAVAIIVNPGLAVWMAPILAGLVLSIPVSLVTGQLVAGKRIQSCGLFSTPEETVPPPELVRLADLVERCRRHPPPLAELADDHGLLQAVLDPYVNAVHVALLREKDSTSRASETRFAALRTTLLRKGPAALTTKDKNALLVDAESMSEIHMELWSAPPSELAEWWRVAIRHYNVLAPVPPTALHR